jgi:hypothetical protein
MTCISGGRRIGSAPRRAVIATARPPEHQSTHKDVVRPLSAGLKSSIRLSSAPGKARGKPWNAFHRTPSSGSLSPRSSAARTAPTSGAKSPHASIARVRFEGSELSRSLRTCATGRRGSRVGLFGFLGIGSTPVQRVSLEPTPRTCDMESPRRTAGNGRHDRERAECDADGGRILRPRRPSGGIGRTQRSSGPTPR